MCIYTQALSYNINIIRYTQYKLLNQPLPHRLQASPKMFATALQL